MIPGPQGLGSSFPLAAGRRLRAQLPRGKGRRGGGSAWRCLSSLSGARRRSRSGCASCRAGGCGWRGAVIRCDWGCRSGRLGPSARRAAIGIVALVARQPFGGRVFGQEHQGVLAVAHRVERQKEGQGSAIAVAAHVPLGAEPAFRAPDRSRRRPFRRRAVVRCAFRCVPSIISVSPSAPGWARPRKMQANAHRRDQRANGCGGSCGVHTQPAHTASAARCVSRDRSRPAPAGPPHSACPGLGNVRLQPLDLPLRNQTCPLMPPPDARPHEPAKPPNGQSRNGSRGWMTLT